MGEPELLRFFSAEALVARAAEDWLRELQQIREPVTYSVALSGGRIAASFFSILAQLPDAPKLLRKTVKDLLRRTG